MRRYGHHTIRYVSIRRETIWLFSIRYDTIRNIIVKIQTFTISHPFIYEHNRGMLRLVGFKPRLHCPGVHSSSFTTRPGPPATNSRGEPGRIVKELECVHTFPAVLRARPGFGQKVITVCPGYATVCDGTFPV